MEPARQLFRRPLHPYTRMLLDAVPDLAMTGRARQPVKGEVPNQGQVDRAGQIARGVEGVKDVDNRLTVTSG